MPLPPLTEVPLTPELVRGAAELERTPRGLLPHRLPAAARARCTDGQLAMAEAQPSGVRLALRTTARVLELDVVAGKRVYVGAPPRPDGVYELVLDGRVIDSGGVPDGDALVIDMGRGTTETRPGPVRTLRFAGLPAGPKDLELWLPHDETTHLVALRADAPVTPTPTDGRRVWAHHGSSISHGSNADRPTGTWPAVAAARGGVELVNLGFGGGALLDPFTARALRDTPADLISVKIGINVVNADLMRARAFGPAVEGFLDTIREGRPTTPLLVVTPVLCPMHEEVPGPSLPDFAAMAEGRVRFVAGGDRAEVASGKLSLGVIRAELARIVARRAAEDPYLWLLDGRELFGEADHEEFPLPDGLHPTPAAHLRMGERFAAHAFAPGGPFAPSPAPAPTAPAS
ncbi:GDSL-type esterase/lipase family protein (plasmid) [Streptomyces sp. BI20]|uniref:GDSL-type esterase/lipase family protein n=1 Tax=Streptomyces sp. BI20 TaxID=3403460 RepID=UPI003C79283D